MDLTTDQNRLQAYLAAEAAILAGNVQEFRENNHWARMLELPALQVMIRELQQKIAAETGSIFHRLRTPYGNVWNP
jgi:hypothetical protein